LVFGVVSAMWLAAAVATLNLPIFELGEDIIIPVAA
jgi:hypothetical protein